MKPEIIEAAKKAKLIEYPGNIFDAVLSNRHLRMWGATDEQLEAFAAIIRKQTKEEDAALCWKTIPGRDAGMIEEAIRKSI